MASNLGVSGAEFKDKVLSSEVPVLVDFWAEWCGPCKAIGPSIEQLASELDGKAKVFKVDVDADPDLATEYGVMSIPAVFVFKGGKVVDQHVGIAAKEKYADMLTRAMSAA
jgi:thioredoxin 1